MGQVPKYGIVGDGRAARHMAHYFSLLKIPFVQWSRKNPSENLRDCKVVLLLISDGAIESFRAAHDFLKTKTCVHFSGALLVDEILSFHPLMTFGPDLYDLEAYAKIPFIGEIGKPTLRQIIPELENRFFSIEASKKAFYHSLCVMSGNFTTLLWQKFFSELDQNFSLPRDVTFPYMNQIVKNLQKNPGGSLTGPLIRKDTLTVQKNLEALEGDPFSAIYQTFVKIFFNEYQGKP